MANKDILECIVCGTGPSFYKYLESYDPNIPKSGCGVASFYTQLAYYSYGDPVHKVCIANKLHHPNVLIYSHPRVYESGHILWDHSWPHGGTSGGQALTVACMHHDVIGLIGFDGLKGQVPPTYPSFVLEFGQLIELWKSKGKRLISLMPESIFNNRLEQL